MTVEPGGRRVALLLVEDNPDDVRLIEEALASAARADPPLAAFELTTVKRLADAIERLRAGGVDVALLDLWLPDSQGLPTFRRAQAAAPMVPVVVLSGLQDEALGSRAVREGAQDHLVKGQVDGRLLVRSLCYAIERKRAEAERARLVHERSERDRLQRILDVLPEGVAIFDADGQPVLYNVAARAIWGEPPRGGDVRDLATLGAEPGDSVGAVTPESPLARSLRRGEVVRGEQLRLRDPAGGRAVPILLNSAPLVEADGSTFGVVVVFQDISAIKELERQKDEFLAAASHDLKTPLASIKGLAQLLLRRAHRPETVYDPRIADGLSRIDRAVSRLTGMVNELLDVARLQMGRPLDLDREPTDLVALAREVVSAARPTTERHRIRVDSDAPSIVGDWDAARLERALSNLVSNAIKYSPEGGEIVIRVGYDEGQARAERGPTAVLSVHDQGLGIPADEIDRVFDRFFRAHNAMSTLPGTGIGLSGTRQIVQQHGGGITVTSELGRGSVFRIWLPLHPPRPGPDSQMGRVPTAVPTAVGPRQRPTTLRGD